MELNSRTQKAGEIHFPWVLSVDIARLDCYISWPQPLWWGCRWLDKQGADCYLINAEIVQNWKMKMIGVSSIKEHKKADFSVLPLNLLQFLLSKLVLLADRIIRNSQTIFLPDSWKPSWKQHPMWISNGRKWRCLPFIKTSLDLIA